MLSLQFVKGEFVADGMEQTESKAFEPDPYFLLSPEPLCSGSALCSQQIPISQTQVTQHNSVLVEGDL